MRKYSPYPYESGNAVILVILLTSITIYEILIFGRDLLSEEVRNYVLIDKIICYSAALFMISFSFFGIYIALKNFLWETTQWSISQDGLIGYRKLLRPRVVKWEMIKCGCICSMRCAYGVTYPVIRLTTDMRRDAAFQKNWAAKKRWRSIDYMSFHSKFIITICYCETAIAEINQQYPSLKLLDRR